jgi:hypothetical protein
MISVPSFSSATLVLALAADSKYKCIYAVAPDSDALVIARPSVMILLDNHVNLPISPPIFHLLTPSSQYVNGTTIYSPTSSQLITTQANP